MNRPRALDLFCGAGGASMGLHRAGFDVTGIDIGPQPHYPFVFVRGDALKPPVRLSDFDLVWASPPCQAHTALRTMWNAREHPNLIPQTRELLQSEARLWVIENVPGAPLRVDAQLCGTGFGLATADGTGELRRHRWFEANFPLGLEPPCQHFGPVIGVYGGHGRDRRRTVDCAGDGGSQRRRTVGVYGNIGSEWCANAPARLRRAVQVWGNAGGSYAIDRDDPAAGRIKAFPTHARREAMGIDWMSGAELSQAIPPAYSEWLGHYAMVALGRVDP